MIRRLAGTSWGWQKQLLRVSYQSLVESVLLYGISSWGPWVSNTQWGKINRVHLAGGRIIGGTMASARKEAVLLEAGLVEIRKKAVERWVVKLEKCRKAKEGDSRKD